MKKTKRRHVIVANFIKFFLNCVYEVKNAVMRCADKLQLNVNNTQNYGYVDLAPTDDADNISEYLRALEWALNDKNITNIALAGPYGAGKSSIIETFLRIHPSIKYINVSLAMFRKNDQDTIEFKGTEDTAKPESNQNMTGDTAGENFEKQLEEGILKQLFYKVHYSRIPQSRYRKLHKVSLGISLMHVMFTLVLIIGLMFFLAPGKLEELKNAYFNMMSILFGERELYYVLFTGVMGMVIIAIMTVLFRWINTKWRSIEINIADKAVIKADEKDEALSLNKNMDEILYFFEETNYTLIVIEDLDRFDTPEVYTKLREINKVINSYDAIQRKIVFIYALKDDIFHNEDRTKLFDFIIPVIPYIDATNSGEYLKLKLEELKSTGLEFDISDDYIMNVSPFLSDMRILNNICNEFIVFKKNIKDSQDLDKLQDVQMLSLIIFKNMYPREFAKLQESEGMIKEAYHDKSSFVKEMSGDLEKKIEIAMGEKEKSDGLGMLDVEDIKLAFIQKLVGDRDVFTKIQVNNTTYTKSEILKYDFSLSQMGTGSANVFYISANYSYGGEQYETKRDIEKTMCSDGITYFEKCDRAIARDKKHRKQIVQNLLDKQKDLYMLRSKTMTTLIKEYGADKVLGENVRKNSLLVFMLRHGYIDDTYQMYINYFLPGSVTADELNFIINVRNYAGNSDWNYRIIHPRNVIDRLFDYELEQQKDCLNFDLADFFYNDNSESNKKSAFTKQLAKNDADSRRFIKEYYVRVKNKAEYIRNIAQQKMLFWYDICSDDGLGYQDKVSYLKDIFMYLTVEDIVLQDTAANDENPQYSICTFIAESDKIIEQLQDSGAEKVVAVLTQIKVKLRNIDLEAVNNIIIEGIFNNELFEISLVMLQNYINFKLGESITNFQTNIYTYILKQKDCLVTDYLERNIYNFVTEVILPTEANTKEDIDTVFRCIKLLEYDQNLSIQFIQKMDIVMEDLKEWYRTLDARNEEVKPLVDTFLAENKMLATIENLDTYKEKYKFTDELCNFVDANIDELISDENLDDVHVKEILKKDIQNETIEKILQNYEMESLGDNLNNYNQNVVQKMIDQRYFKYTRSRYNEIQSSFDRLLPLFIKRYWKEFEQDISNINFELTTINVLFKSNLDDEKKAVILNGVNVSQMTREVFDFVRDTDVSISKKYVQETWDNLETKDRPAFMIKYFSVFSISEIENMFVKMPKEYQALKQMDKRHEVLLEKNAINEVLCQKLKDINYISSYGSKIEKNGISTSAKEKLFARVRAKR